MSDNNNLEPNSNNNNLGNNNNQGDPFDSSSKESFFDKFNLPEDNENYRKAEERFPAFVTEVPFRLLLGCSMLEDIGYSEKSFRRAVRTNYRLEDPRRAALEDLEKLFDEMVKLGDFDNIKKYIIFQYNLIDTKFNISESEEDRRDPTLFMPSGKFLDETFTMFSEERQRLVTEGVTVENNELKSKILFDVNTISDKLIEFFQNLKCVNEWDAKEFGRFLIATQLYFRYTFVDFFKGHDEGEVIDSNCINEYSKVMASVMTNLYQAITVDKSKEDLNPLKSLYNTYKWAKVVRYKGVGFDSPGIIFETLDRIKLIATTLSKNIETLENKRSLAEKAELLNSVPWIKNPPYDVVDRSLLKMPKGEIYILVSKKDSPSQLGIFFSWRNNTTEIIFSDDTLEKTNTSFVYYPRLSKSRIIELAPCHKFYVHSTDTASTKSYDSYISDKREEWFKCISSTGVNLKYSGLQFLAYFEKNFPNIFDNGHTQDPIQFFVDVDDAKLMIKTSRTFIDNHMDLFEVVGNKIRKREKQPTNDPIEGEFVEENNVELFFKENMPNQEKAKKTLEEVSLDEVIITFPLHHFIPGAEPTVKEVQEPPKPQKIDYWAKIDDLFSGRSKNTVTYRELISLLKPFGTLIVKKDGGKGSHRKIFFKERPERVSIVSSDRYRHSLYTGELKHTLEDLHISFKDFYNKISQSKKKKS